MTKHCRYLCEWEGQDFAWSNLLKMHQFMKRLAIAKQADESQHQVHEPALLPHLASTNEYDVKQLQSNTTGTVLDIGSPGQRLRWLLRLVEEKMRKHV